jgi:hypothetical protein
VPHHHPAGVAGQALGRSSWNAHPVLEDRLARLIGVRQHLGIDVDHDLVTLARGAGIEVVVQGGLREQRQRVGLLLLQRRRVGLRRLLPPLLVQALAGRGQGLHEQRADLGRQPSADPHRPVLVRIHVQRPAGVLPGGLPGLGLAVHSPPAAHDPLDVLGGAGASHRQQAFLGLRRGHARELPDLGVRQLPAGQGLGQPGQRAQGARHPHVLARGAGGEPHPPGQPGGAGGEAGVPAAAGVELPDEVEEAGGGGVEVRGEPRDLVTQPVEV